MLHYSFATILMAFAATNLLVIVLTFCFRNIKVMINAGYKLLALFILFTILRFLLPFEFPFTTSVYWSNSISKSIWQIHYWLFDIVEYHISPWIIFQFIWIVGICIELIRYITLYYKTRQYITLNAKNITGKEPYSSLINQICNRENKPNHFTFIELPNIEVPVLYGIRKPCILIPEDLQLSDTDWYYILHHEASHHFHHDILLKNIIKLFTIIYWWNPFCHKLYEQADVILEMRVDATLTSKDPETTSDYMRCLINVSERANEKKSSYRPFTMSLLPPEISDMGKRFEMLIANQQKKKRSIGVALLIIALTIYILSYAIIIEAFELPESRELQLLPTMNYEQTIIPSEVESYALQREDGLYDIYCEHVLTETVDSLEFFLDIPVYTEEDCPY